MIDAIARGDPDALFALLDQHIERTRQSYTRISRYRQGGPGLRSQPPSAAQAARFGDGLS